MKVFPALALTLGLCSALSAVGEPSRAYYVAATNAVRKAADADKCRWGSFRMREFFDDDVLQCELDAALTASCPALYKDAMACSGKAGDPALVALYEPFVTALTNTPTMRQIAACAADRGFSPVLSVSIADLCLLNRPDGRRFCGGVTCSSVSADPVRILACMIPVFRKGAAAAPLMRVTGSGRDVRGLAYVSSFSPRGDVYTFAANGGSPERECAPSDAKSRRIHPPKPLSSVDADRLWDLLSCRVEDLKTERLLALLGRPSEVAEISYVSCGRKEYAWRYEFTDNMEDGTPCLHRLGLTLSKGGSCVGWTWCASAVREESAK